VRLEEGGGDTHDETSDTSKQASKQATTYSFSVHHITEFTSLGQHTMQMSYAHILSNPMPPHTRTHLLILLEDLVVD
jgi:hypothetical protein